MKMDMHFDKQTAALLAAFFVFMGSAGSPSFAEGEQRPTAPYSFKFSHDLKSDEKDGGALNQPAGIALGDNGDLFVADTLNNRVVVFSASGKVVNVFGKAGDADGEFKIPMAVAVDTKRDRVYVSDSGHYRLQVFKTNGEFVSVIDLNKDAPKEEKKVRPLGVAVNRESRIYVADADNNCVRVFSPDGKPLFRFGGSGNEDGKFFVPVGVAVGGDDTVYVVDMNNARLQAFDREGKFLFKTGERGDTKGSFGMPKDVGVSAEGLIFVSDAGNLVVQVFDKEGRFLDVIGVEPDAERQFAAPFGLAVGRQELYVTDRWKQIIRVYEISR